MTLKDESEPLDDDEWLYRRVYKDRFRSSKVPFISPKAYEPRATGHDIDEDGISLYRADCLDSPEQVLELIKNPEKRRANGIVRLRVREFRRMGLTVKPTRHEHIPGHVSIPEMSADAMLDEAGKARCKKWMHDLAVLSSPEDRIVIRPADPDE